MWLLSPQKLVTNQLNVTWSAINYTIFYAYWRIWKRVEIFFFMNCFKTIEKCRCWMQNLHVAFMSASKIHSMSVLQSLVLIFIWRSQRTVSHLNCIRSCITSALSLQFYIFLSIFQSASKSFLLGNIEWNILFVCVYFGIYVNSIKNAPILFLG